ncbi:MAG: hypothetical protein WCH11_07315 [Bdellovibrio sp.]
MHRVARYKLGTLALVLSLLLLGVSSEASPVDPPRPRVQDPVKPSQVTLDSLTPSPVEAPQSIPSEELLIPTMRLAQSAWIASVGIWSGDFADIEAPPTLSFGFAKSFYENEDRVLDYGLEILQNGYWGGKISRKWIFSPYTWSEPYLRVGGGSLWKLSESLASFINIYRYQIRFALGFEDLFKTRRRWRAEIGLAWGLSGLSLTTNLGFGF